MSEPSGGPRGHPSDQPAPDPLSLPQIPQSPQSRQIPRSRQVPQIPPDVAPTTLAARVLSGDRRTAVRVGRAFLALAVVLAGWIVVLGFTLPSHAELDHQDVAWVGFDIGLLVGLVGTAWAALRRSRFLPVAAAATAALLVADAWFDVIGSSSAGEFWQALAMALVVELPLSGLCWWIALHAQQVAQQRIAEMVLRRIQEQAGEQAVEQAPGDAGLGSPT